MIFVLVFFVSIVSCENVCNDNVIDCRQCINLGCTFTLSGISTQCHTTGAISSGKQATNLNACKLLEKILAKKKKQNGPEQAPQPLPTAIPTDITSSTKPSVPIFTSTTEKPVFIPTSTIPRVNEITMGLLQNASTTSSSPTLMTPVPTVAFSMKLTNRNFSNIKPSIIIQQQVPTSRIPFAPTHPTPTRRSLKLYNETRSIFYMPVPRALSYSQKRNISNAVSFLFNASTTASPVSYNDFTLPQRSSNPTIPTAITSRTKLSVPILKSTTEKPVFIPTSTIPRVNKITMGFLQNVSATTPMPTLMTPVPTVAFSMKQTNWNFSTAKPLIIIPAQVPTSRVTPTHPTLTRTLKSHNETQSSFYMPVPRALSYSQKRNISNAALFLFNTSTAASPVSQNAFTLPQISSNPVITRRSPISLQKSTTTTTSTTPKPFAKPVYSSNASLQKNDLKDEISCEVDNKSSSNNCFNKSFFQFENISCEIVPISVRKYILQLCKLAAIKSRLMKSLDDRLKGFIYLNPARNHAICRDYVGICPNVKTKPLSQNSDSSCTGLETEYKVKTGCPNSEKNRFAEYVLMKLCLMSETFKTASLHFRDILFYHGKLNPMINRGKECQVLLQKRLECKLYSLLSFFNNF